VLAGGLLVGTLIAPAAGLAGTQASAASLADANVGEAPAATVQFQAPIFHDDKLQIVLPDDAASGGSGENNQMGSAVAWMTRTDSSR
jgi:acetyl-CoA carboxylase beta subunit